MYKMYNCITYNIINQLKVHAVQAAKATANLKFTFPATLLLAIHFAFVGIAVLTQVRISENVENHFHVLLILHG